MIESLSGCRNAATVFIQLKLSIILVRLECIVFAATADLGAWHIGQSNPTLQCLFALVVPISLITVGSADGARILVSLT